jgi:hypothetical protein
MIHNIFYTNILTFLVGFVFLFFELGSRLEPFEPPFLKMAGMREALFHLLPVSPEWFAIRDFFKI